MVQLIRPILLISSIVTAGACASSGGGGGGDDDGISSSSSDSRAPRNVVVVRIGHKKPVLDPRGRKHWLKARGGDSATPERIQALLATGEGPAAAAAARTYLAQNPGDIEGLVMLSTALALDGKYDLAAFYGRLLEEKKPGHPHGANMRGLAALMNAKRMADFRTAVQLFKRAYDGSDTEIAGGLNLGNLYLELGNAKSASDVFEDVRDRCGNCVSSLLGHGIALRRLKQYKDALALFDQILEKEEEHGLALYHSALAYKGLKDQDSARDRLRRLVDSSKVQDRIKEHAHALLRNIGSRVARKEGEEGEGGDQEDQPVEQDRGESADASNEYSDEYPDEQEDFETVDFED